MRSFGLLFVVLALVLPGCARHDGGAPVYYGARGDTVSPPVRGKAPYVVTVQKGDTVYGIARANYVDVKTLIEENQLTSPFILSVGQKIRIPKPRYHVVRRGETLYSISRLYGVDTASLALMNDIGPPYMIGSGQKLVLPGRERSWIRRNVVDRVPLPKAEDKERKGGKASTVKLNQHVRSKGRFLWPANGRVVSGFGPIQGGLHNDGINILVPNGAPIFASDDGEVTYVGSELNGYGNLVLIRHSGDWVTAYSHNRRIHVGRGDKVRRGQHIADAGSTGSVDRPQLHFELRKGSKAVDPMDYLSTN